jgi:GxxExxY protein
MPWPMNSAGLGWRCCSNRRLLSITMVSSGKYVTDLLVEDTILVELNAVRELGKAHMAQCINYLTATGLHLCLLLNFGKSRVKVQRIVRGL